MPNVSFYIARRYLSSKRKKNVINIITRISVVGITIITASLVILLSAFNGIEKMIEKLYSDFDAPITIRSSQTKTFFENEIDLKKLSATPGVKQFAKATEEIVVLKHEDKWVNATLLGTDSVFLSLSKISSHMVDGFPALYENNEPVGLIGATLLDKLGGYIPQEYGSESVMVYAPKRDMKMSVSKNPFFTQRVQVVGRINYNREVNAEMMIVPIDLAQTLLGYADNELNALLIDIDQHADKHRLKQTLQEQLGESFKVRTNDEKNELIFQTSKTERLIVIVILLFIFVLASFNLVASLTMLFVEKKEDIQILKSLGADEPMIFRIFFYEGLLIAAKGIFFGLFLGYLICFLQIQFGLLEMPNSFGEKFPVVTTFFDGVLILSLVSLLSLFASYFPVKMLLKRNATI
ncbi:MAG: FtsX-like permease family protein [Crocinitomicaceae bacterium]|nr:FtsX-like permease family protein [Crocinitomicaceae bacterium]